MIQYINPQARFILNLKTHYSMKNKILIIDDDKNYRLLLCDELKDEGYDVIEAESGHEGLEKIASQKPDCVTLDIKMGDENGLDVLEQIRNDYDLPVILLTAYETYKRDRRSLGADFYVVKSSELTELKRKIYIILNPETSVLSHSVRDL